MNEVVAEKSGIKALIAIAVFVFGAMALFAIVSGFLEMSATVYVICGMISITAVPFLVYSGMNQSEEERVRCFNRKTYG